MPPPPSPLEGATRLLATHLPTSRHVAMLFDMLLDHLGELAVVTTEAAGGTRRLYRRESPGSENVTPWPEVVVSLGGQTTFTTRAFRMDGSDELDTEPPAPEAPPSKLRGLGTAELTLYDGEQWIRLRYGDDGRVADRSLNDLVPGRLEGVVAALAARTAQPVELVAAYMASLAPWRHGPGRVRLPVPVPGGVAGTWYVGRLGARRAVFTGRAPASARFVVVDGIAGTALGFGATRDEAIAAFEAEVRRAQPRPSMEIETPTDDYDDEGNLIARGEPILPPDPGAGARSPFGGVENVDEPSFDVDSGRIDLGQLVVRGPTPDVAMPPLSIETTPFAIIPLDPSPAAPPPMGTWVRTLGAHGETRHAARIDTPTGFLLVGERAFPYVRPATLYDELDAADASNGFSLEDALAIHPEYAPFKRFSAVSYRWTPATDRRPAGFTVSRTSQGPVFDPAHLDGDAIAGEIRRQTRIPRGSWKPY